MNSEMTIQESSLRKNHVHSKTWSNMMEKEIKQGLISDKISDFIPNGAMDQNYMWEYYLSWSDVLDICFFHTT